MFQSLVITLREGVEAALIVGIVLSYLKKVGRQGWNRTVYLGLAAAVVASLIAAYFVYRFEVAEELYEGWLMLAGAVFVASMVYWVWRTGRHMKQEIETRLSSISTSPNRSAALGLFFLVFLMVFREGIETVIFLEAVSLRTTELMDFMGGVIGLALAIGLGVTFFKGSLRIDLGKFFKITSLVLLVVAAQLLLSGIHELSEAQILPASRREMALIGPIVNNESFFFIVIVALAMFLIIAQRIQASSGKAGNFSQLSPPERRKLLAEQQRDRFWKLTASAVSLLVIVMISAELIFSRAAQAMTPPERLTLVNGEARIPTSELTDHKLHLYDVKVQGADVRLLAILDSSGTVHAALDACLICGTQGYYRDGRNVICRNCGAAIYIPTIGVAGGCNPIHIDFQVVGDTLRIPESALASAAQYFR
jgi:high-affinity iron transporter